ncbi:uncharacterized protein F5147DRAFT_611864 [Suillus discolor]|uniref:BTB domain-containing protein n=1 Tax=Suillus discolor TaxID=1912936 RepID=A0A9P7F9V2_9AGAM|nr:uncharacterized protein F5147DRAFT_611864 [Suillus discolor]KAG2109714.1 hypothetical protein F5147DRAFT_611864 [Suillus discolor]
MAFFSQSSDSVNENGHITMFGEPLNSRGVQSLFKADIVDPPPTLHSTELPESTRVCVASHESTGKIKEAESPIRLGQETGLPGPSTSKPPPLSSQISNIGVEQASTVPQKTSPCVDKDDAKSYGKVKEKRKFPRTIGNDTDQGRPLKRARSECASPQKHEDFYILDANTVIEVDGVLFKLHRSRLVTKSSFFAQLLQHDLKDNFLDDGVRVENDGKATVYHLGNITTADDLVALLKFDDNPTEYYFQPPPFSVLAPILRAATALRFETYRVWAARVLGQMWSSSLADLTPEPMKNAVEIIALARSCDVNVGVVKRALYELARTRRIDLEGHDVLGQQGPEQIGHADQKCVELMRELSVTTWSEIGVRIGTSSCQQDYAQKFTFPSKFPSNNKNVKSSAQRETYCPCSFRSGNEQATWDERVHDSGLYTKFLFDPVCGAQALIDIPWGEEGWCLDCIQSKRAAWRKIQQKVWSDMDKWIPGNV